MIKTELTHHPVAYSVLSLGLGLFITLFFIAWPNPLLERLVIGGFAIFYMLWGIITHRVKGSVTSEVVKEYCIVAVLGALLLLMLTF